MSIGKVLYLRLLYYFVIFSFCIVYLLCFVKLCKSFVQKNDFYHPTDGQKYGGVLFVQWVQAWQHMLFTSTLNK